MSTGLESPVLAELQQAIEQSPYLIFPAFNQTTIKRNNNEDEKVIEFFQRINLQDITRSPFTKATK